MAPSYSTSALSSGTTNRPTLLHVPDSFGRREKRGSALWSKWIRRSLGRRKLDPKPDKARSESADWNHSHFGETSDMVPKGSLKRPWGKNRHRKSVTFEEPGDTARGAVDSDEETVRRSRKVDGLGDSPEVQPRDRGVPGPWPEAPAGNKGGDHHALGQQYLQVPTSRPQRVGGGLSPDDDRQAHKSARKGGVRTVSHDDYLTGRGANPRTGLVSPSVSSSSRPSKDGAPRHGRRKPQSSQKWRLKGDQWISMDTDDKTPLPSPTADDGDALPTTQESAQERAQAYINRLTNSGIPLEKMNDRFVVNMPSANDPNPPSMSTQQISEFQKAVDRLRRHGGEPVDPNTPPTPRAVTPEGRSTPSDGLHKFFQSRPAGTAFRRQQGNRRQARSLARGGHVHFATPSEGRTRRGARPQKAREAWSVIPRNLDKKTFLGEQEAGGKNRIPAFQLQDTPPSPSPPWMKATVTSDQQDEKRPMDTQTGQTEQSLHRHMVCGGELWVTGTRADMENNPANPSVQVPHLDQPAQDNMFTTTITSTMGETHIPTAMPVTSLHMCPKLKEGGGQVTELPEDVDCVSQLSSQLLLGKANSFYMLGDGHVNVDAKSTADRGETLSADRDIPIQDGTSGMVKSRGTGQAIPGSGTNWNNRDVDSWDCPRSKAEIGSRSAKSGEWNFHHEKSRVPDDNESEYKRTSRSRKFMRMCTWCKCSDEQLTVAHICFHLQEAVLSTLVFCLNTMIYLCDMLWAHLRSKAGRGEVPSTESSENNPGFQVPNRSPSTQEDLGWVWPLAGTIGCLMLLVLVLRFTAYIVRIGLWAIWLLRLWT